MEIISTTLILKAKQLHFHEENLLALRKNCFHSSNAFRINFLHLVILSFRNCKFLLSVENLWGKTTFSFVFHISVFLFSSINNFLLLIKKLNEGEKITREIVGIPFRSTILRKLKLSIFSAGFVSKYLFSQFLLISFLLHFAFIALLFQEILFNKQTSRSIP